MKSILSDKTLGSSFQLSARIGTNWKMKEGVTKTGLDVGSFLQVSAFLQDPPRVSSLNIKLEENEQDRLEHYYYEELDSVYQDPVAIPLLFGLGLGVGFLLIFRCIDSS